MKSHCEQLIVKKICLLPIADLGPKANPRTELDARGVPGEISGVEVEARVAIGAVIRPGAGKARPVALVAGPVGRVRVKPDTARERAGPIRGDSPNWHRALLIALAQVEEAVVA